MTSRSANIFQLQRDLTYMRLEYPEMIAKYEYKINKLKFYLLTNANYTAEPKCLEIPTFPLEKYEQIVAESEDDPLKMKAKLKSEIIIMRTLLKQEKCSMAQLLK